MYINELLRNDVGGIDFLNEESKNKIKQRSAELGVATLINPETGCLSMDLRSSEINATVELAVYAKAKKISVPLLRPSKKNVKNAIDFLELLGLLATPKEDSFILAPENSSKRKSAVKMIGHLEYLRKNMDISKSALKLNAKTTITCVDKLFSTLPLAEKLALKDSVINAEKIIKAYFQ